MLDGADGRARTHEHNARTRPTRACSSSAPSQKSAYVSIRQHTSAYVRHMPVGEVDRHKDCLGLAVLGPLLRPLPEKARQRFLSFGRGGANEVHLKVEGISSSRIRYWQQPDKVLVAAE